MARILVIDDDVPVRNAIRTMLERRRHHVVVAECGQRGVPALEAYAFDVVIVDIFMPGMDGFESIRILRQSAPKIAIIAITGYAFREVSWPVPDFLKMACELGATCCLRKPVKARELVQAVEAACTAPRSRLEPVRGAGAFAPVCADPCA
jgi:CheY-like chemotaxis protein